MNAIDLTRRNFSKAALASVAAAAVAPTLWIPKASAQSSPFVLPALPYSESALSPVISASTIAVHYGKHHKAYVDWLNNAAKDSARWQAFAGLSLADIIRATSGKADQAAVFNNAGQLWNHTFYWRSLRPAGKADIPARMSAALIDSFGSMDAFRQAFAATTVSQFGSGWGWLVQDVASKKLKVVRTSNAEVPFTQGLTPLLTIDVWEHAYYIDYQNKRADYVNAVIDQLLNWEFALSNMA